MQKTKKAIAKKFKVTALGKVMRRKPGFRHFLRRKSAAQGRQATHDLALDSNGLAKRIKQSIPFA